MKEEEMKSKQLSQYMNRCIEDYKQFMGISALPEFKLISKHISFEEAEVAGWGTWGKHKFDFQKKLHTIEVWEDIWKTCKHADYIMFHELTHLLDNENYVKGDKNRNVAMRGFFEYHASQVETIKILKNININDIIPFSVNQKIQTITST